MSSEHVGVTRLVLFWFGEHLESQLHLQLLLTQGAELICKAGFLEVAPRKPFVTQNRAHHQHPGTKTGEWNPTFPS